MTAFKKKCRSCGRAFTAVAAQHYCYNPCESPTRIKTRPAELEEQECAREGCQVVFLPISKNHRFCGPACQGRVTPAEPRIARGRQPNLDTEYRSRKAWRKAYLKMVEYRCQSCNRTGEDLGEYLHVHHAIPEERGGKHTLRNARLLCRNCHQRSHRVELPRPGYYATGSTTIPAIVAYHPHF